MLNPMYTQNFKSPPLIDMVVALSLAGIHSNSTTRAKARRLLKRQYARDQYAKAIEAAKAKTRETGEKHYAPPLKIIDGGTVQFARVSDRTIKFVFDRRGK